MRIRYSKIFPLVLVLLTLGWCCTSCSDDDTEANPEQAEIVTYKVAMVLREADGQRIDNQRIADWVMANMEAAQEGLPTKVRLELEWYDEDTEDLDKLGRELASRQDIFAIIGPNSSEHATRMAYQCSFTRKCLILPVVSAAEGVRAMAGSQFMWTLVETDITQSEILLSTVYDEGHDKVSLIAKNSIYGQTFIDWFAYQATELGLEVGKIETYDDAAQLDAIVAGMPEQSAVICVPEGPDEMVRIMNARQQCGQNNTAYYFSDSVLERTLLNGGFTGFARCCSFYADPSSGFKIAYEERFGNSPIDVDAHIYDALMLTGFAAAYCASNNSTDAYRALCEITAFKNREVTRFVWEGQGMKDFFRQLTGPGELTIDIRGASGNLDFDERIKTCVTHSTYCLWNVWGRGNYATVSSCEYRSSDGSNRTNADLANWNWQTSSLQEISDTEHLHQHPSLTDQWALIVASSKGWINYRHQADALRMYQNLKRYGFDDDHIVLIAEDDLAANEYNPAPGSVISPLGEDIYAGAKIDYRPSDIHMTDIQDILLGRASERLPHVIASDSTQNVLVFWSGHGSMKGEFVWLEQHSGISHNMMRDWLMEAAGQNHYRKMLWLVESCYGEAVMRAADGLPDILCYTAANRYEESKADIYNVSYRTYLTNRFTTTLLDAYEANPVMPFRDLYYELARGTIASHVCIINAENNDNLFRSNIQEFMQYSPRESRTRKTSNK